VKRKHILDEAIRLTTGDREQQHGDPRRTFDRIARQWGAYLGTEITAHDVCLMMTLLKLVRAGSGEANDDDYIDGAGYIALAAEVGSDRIGTLNEQRLDG